MSALALSLPVEPTVEARCHRRISPTRGGVRTARASMFLSTALDELRQHHSLPGPRVPHDLPRRAHDVQWSSEAMCGLHGVAVRTSGAIPRGPCLLVANHLGHLDPLAIASVVPCVAIVPHEASTWPRLGEALLRLGNLFVRRGDAGSGAAALLRARACLARGVPVLAFPEGTPTAGDDVLPLRRGIFGLARLTGLPVVPVAVRARVRPTAWVCDRSLLPHALRTPARTAAQVDLSFGPVLPPHAAASAQGLAAMARDQLRALLHDLDEHS